MCVGGGRVSRVREIRRGQIRPLSILFPSLVLLFTKNKERTFSQNTAIDSSLTSLVRLPQSSSHHSHTLQTNTSHSLTPSSTFKASPSPLHNPSLHPRHTQQHPFILTQHTASSYQGLSATSTYSQPFQLQDSLTARRHAQTMPPRQASSATAKGRDV